MLFWILYLCGTVVCAFFAYLYELETPKATHRDALFLVFLAINLLFWILLSALVDLKNLVTGYINSRQHDLSDTIRQAMTFVLPIVHAGCWLMWGILLQADKQREAFLLYFGCSAAQAGALCVQIKERRFRRQLGLELVEVKTYFD